MSRLDPENPDTWGACACGDPGVYLVKVEKPNADGEGRLGDYSGKGRTIHSRYFVVCDGCHEVGDAVDRIRREWSARTHEDTY